MTLTLCPKVAGDLNALWQGLSGALKAAMAAEAEARAAQGAAQDPSHDAPVGETDRPAAQGAARELAEWWQATLPKIIAWWAHYSASMASMKFKVMCAL